MTLARRNVKAFDRSYRHEITRLWRLPIATLLEHERKMNESNFGHEPLYRSNEIRIPIGRIRSLPTSFTPILIVQGTFVGRFVVRIRICMKKFERIWYTWKRRWFNIWSEFVEDLISLEANLSEFSSLDNFSDIILEYLFYFVKGDELRVRLQNDKIIWLYLY